MQQDLRIVYHDEDTGQCCVVIPAPAALQTSTIEQIAHQTVPMGAQFRIVHKDKLPQSREFRNAWTDKLPTDTVDVDLEAAKKIHMDRIRYHRNKLLAASDVELTRALEDGDQKALAAVKAKRKALRDLPQTFDLSTVKSAEELAQKVPDGITLSEEDRRSIFSV